MKSLQNNKSLIVSILLFAVVIFGYNMFLKPDQATIDNSVATKGVGNDVVALNQSLQSATLDQALFNSKTYRGLVDFSMQIPQQPTGRTNPFDIIGQ